MPGLRSEWRASPNPASLAPGHTPPALASRPHRDAPRAPAVGPVAATRQVRSAAEPRSCPFGQGRRDSGRPGTARRAAAREAPHHWCATVSRRRWRELSRNPTFPPAQLRREAHVDVRHEHGHNGARIVAMDCTPTNAATGNYGLPRSIAPMFSDFKTHDPGIDDTRLRRADRSPRADHELGHVPVRGGRLLRRPQVADAARKTTAEQSHPGHWRCSKLARSCLAWFPRGLTKPLRLANVHGTVPACKMKPLFHRKVSRSPLRCLGPLAPPAFDSSG